MTTRSGMSGILRAALVAGGIPPQGCDSVILVRRHGVDPVSCRLMDPVRVPSIPAASFPLPPRLEGLRRLAYNLHWSWHPRTRGLFNLIDRTAWARYRNPIPVISGPTEWSRLLDDAKFLAEYHDVLAEFDSYMANGADHWFQRRYGDSLPGPIAYFCAEYGFHESLGIYSGGLGVLAGDHMKTASDMALPVIGVGLLYRKGYFRQTIDADGHQEHDYPDYDLSRLPLSRVQDASGLPLTVTLELTGRDLSIAVWLAQVGRIPVLLLDTDLPENDEADRPITNILYVRGREMRLHQELVLGIGGVRAIRALGLAPAVWHLNEGHSAFLLAERAREYVASKVPLEDAWKKVRDNSVFTIHTPVSAGNERFDADLVRRVAGPLLDAGGVPVEQVLDLGLGVDEDAGGFDMTAFSLRLTRGANAVSHLHAETANATWQRILDHPILAITNGIHGPTWIGEPIAELIESLGGVLDDLDESTANGRFWERLERIPARDLWDAHLRQKRELAHFARGRLRSQFARHGEAPSVLAELERALDPDVLTIGFARRFATYKRAGLLFSDIDRLAKMLADADRPVQVVFAGKAHPADRPGQHVIQEIFQRSRSPQLRGRVFILEDYNMRVARFLVQGVDVWLNNPRRPLEASGTSGMKAAQNGVPNVSVLDGWWDEGYERDNGWAIGDRETDPDEAAQDWRDAQDLYRLLEEEIVPRYYERDPAGLPPRWLDVMRRAMATALWRFSTTRMLHEYTESLYLPAAGVPVIEPVVVPVVTEAG
jgi:glycogen phosphorylase